MEEGSVHVSEPSTSMHYPDRLQFCTWPFITLSTSSSGRSLESRPSLDGHTDHSALEGERSRENILPIGRQSSGLNDQISQPPHQSCLPGAVTRTTSPWIAGRESTGAIREWEARVSIECIGTHGSCRTEQPSKQTRSCYVEEEEQWACGIYMMSGQSGT